MFVLLFYLVNCWGRSIQLTPTLLISHLGLSSSSGFQEKPHCLLISWWTVNTSWMDWPAVPCVTLLTSHSSYLLRLLAPLPPPFPSPESLHTKLRESPFPVPNTPLQPHPSYVWFCLLLLTFPCVHCTHPHGHQRAWLRGFFSLVSVSLLSTQPCSDNAQTQITSCFPTRFAQTSLYFLLSPQPHHCLLSFRFPILNSVFILSHCSCFLWKNYLIILSYVFFKV